MERKIFKKSRGLLCQRVDLRYGFIRQQMRIYPVTLLCRMTGVSRNEFYAYKKWIMKKQLALVA
jgi:hypothetical protein